MRTIAKSATFILCLLLAAWTADALADPPAHAPAHGWRKKHDPYYVGYSGKHWDDDYGVLTGRCNREAVATVLGGVIGGAIGSRVTDSADRTVAIIIGAAAGAIIGNKIGRELDEADRGCFGHALEVGKTGQAVSWTNDATGVRYEMVPGADRNRNDDTCREFTLRAYRDTRQFSEQGMACESQPGVWSVAK